MSKRTGRVLLRDFIRDQHKPGAAPPGFKFSTSEFARVIRASRQQLRFWTMGAAQPSAAHRKELEAATAGAVPASSWD